MIDGGSLGIRRHPVRLTSPEYPLHFPVKRITTRGTFKFGKRLLYVANALTDHQFGLEETDDGRWTIYFHTVLLSTFDERDCIIQSWPACTACCRTKVLIRFPAVQ